ncbi:MAG: glycosyltransferase family A protein [Candidatus Micrarchaeota archaeon]|nr:glycosyltransferase family A protein [Candidatus Micrarchaeota archaeon]
MKYPELISYEKKYGECKNDLLIIIPCFINYDLLVRHLGYLSRQTFRKFDVILVLGPDFNDSKLFDFLKSNKFDFGVIVVKEKESNGVSGSFFIGQKYGYDKGYGYIIHADDDCMPVDPGVVGALYSRREIGCVYSTKHIIFETNVSISTNFCLNHYALFSRDIFEKYGFYYFPLYYGGEDNEFFERIRNEKHVTVPNFVEHPYSFAGSMILKNPTKMWIYMLADLIILKLDISRFIGILYFCMMSSLSLFFMPIGKRIFATMNSLLISCKFGKEAFLSIEDAVKGTIFLQKKDLPEGLGAINWENILHVKKGMKDKIFSISSEALSFFRNDVLVVNSLSQLKIFMLCALCRTVYLRVDDDRHIMMASNRNSILHILKIILFPVFFISYCLIFMLLFVPLKILKQPKTRGYGLDDEKQQ